jgi:histidyl-tRNA synthetase
LHDTALVAIDKLDKIGREGVLNDMLARGIAQEHAEAALERLAGESSSVPASNGGEPAENVVEIMRLSEATPAAGRVKFTPRLARGLSYYTGAIMEIAVPDLAGSLGGGGRYDGLIGMFSGENIPACGFSLGLERILVVMAERGMFPPDVDRRAADILVTIFDAASIGDSLELARELRRAGYRVDVYPEPDKLGKQFKYASTNGVRLVAVSGPDERARGVITIKDMDTGEQRQLSRQELTASPQPR